MHQDLCVDIVPKSSLPGLELEIDKRNQIPHLLQKAELSSAILQLLVRRFLDIEKCFEVVQVSGLSLDLEGVVVVFSDLSVSIRNDLRRGTRDVVWASSLELHSVFSNLNLELSESVLNVASLLCLEWQNCLLDWAESLFTDLNECSL